MLCSCLMSLVGKQRVTQNSTEGISRGGQGRSHCAAQMAYKCALNNGTEVFNAQNTFKLELLTIRAGLVISESMQRSLWDGKDKCLWDL